MTSTPPADGGRTDQYYREQLRALREPGDEPPGNRLRQILRLGTDRYDATLGLLVRTDRAGDTYTIDEVSAPHSDLTRGLTGDLLSTYCRMVVAEQAPLAIENAPKQGWAADPAYQSSLLSTYLGTAVHVRNEVYGTVCFVDLEPREAPFDEGDRSFLELIGQAVEEVLEQRTATDTDDGGDPDQSLSVVERRYRTALKHSPVLFAKVDRDLRYEWICNPHEDFDPASVIGKRDDELDAGPGIDQLVALKRRTLEQGEQLREEIVFERSDGLHVYDVTATPLREGEGNVVTGLITASLDITDRKEKERRLEESEARYRALAENFPDGAVGVYDPDLRYTLVRGLLVDDVLPSADEFEGALVSEVFPEQTASDIVPLFRAAVEDGATGSAETTFAGRDWKVWATPLRDRDGTIFAGLSFAQDVTEQKQQEARLRDLSNSVPGVVFQFFARPDGTYGFHFVSEHAEDMLGIPPDPDTFYERCLERIPDAHQEAFQSSIEEAVEERSSWESEVPFVKPSGERRWILGRSIPREQDGEVVFNGVLLDITDRKEAEQAHHRMAEAMEVASDGMALLSEEGVYTYMNQAHAEIFGYDSPDAFLGNTWRMCYEEPQIERFEEEFMPILHEEGTWTGEVTGQRKDGTLFPQQVTLTQLEDGGLICITRDITERKNAERQLQESERRFRKVFENAAIGIVIGDNEGRLLRANPAFQSMLGYEEDELRGRHFSEITHPDDVDPDANFFEELTEGKRDRYQVEKRYTRKDGVTFWGRLTVSLLDLDDEKKHVALVEDIDEQKHYEEQLRTAKREAEEAARLKSVMLANMSHEVRTPLTSMIGFSGLLASRLDGKAAKLARLIRKSGQRLEETMEAVLQLSQLEAGGYTLDRDSLSLDSLVHRIVDEFELQADEAGVTIHVETPDTPVEAYVDDTAVRRVINNLLDNALKFTPEGGEVWVRTYADGAETVVEIEDTGVGIAEEALSDVFTAFKQESEGLTREYEGAGLGLSIVRELVDALGGTITLDSEKGEGTCVTVRLPRTKGSASQTQSVG